MDAPREEEGKPLAFYKFFLGDYYTDASHLSLLEHGAYRRLIDLYMIQRGPLPFDLPRLYRLLHATSKEEQAAVQCVIEEFFRMDGATLRHKKCDAVLREIGVTSSNASSAANARWDIARENRRANMQLELDTTALPAQYKCNATQTQTKTKTKTKTKANPSADAPEWAETPQGVRPDVWLAWKDVRKAMRAPMTLVAYRHAAKQLRDFERDGHKPNTVVEQSAANGWRGLFKPKERDTMALPAGTQWG